MEVRCTPSNPPKPPRPVKMLSLNQVMNLTTYGKSQIYDLMAQGLFPASVKLGRKTCWIEAEVLDYLDDMIAASRNPDPKGGQ